MKREKTSYPKRYWVYLAVCVVSTVMLFGNIFWAVAVTEEREISEFTGTDWMYFRRFLIAEGVSLFLAFFFAGKFCKITAAHRGKIRGLENRYFQNQYQGIRLKEYDDVYFFSANKRAVIGEESGCFLLDIQEFDVEEGVWKPVDAVRGYPSEKELWSALRQKLDCDSEKDLEDKESCAER